MLLEYTDTKFTDKEFDCGPAPNFDKSCWFDIKFDLGLDFPNLPYYKDGELIPHHVQLNTLCGYLILIFHYLPWIDNYNLLSFFKVIST